MVCVVLVIGGLCGIGVVILKVFKVEGYEVVVMFVGNEEKVVVFIVEIGIKIYKWNVVDYEVLKVGIVQVEVDFGLIDVVVVNVGIMCDVLFYKMLFEQW